MKTYYVILTAVCISPMLNGVNLGTISNTSKYVVEFYDDEAKGQLIFPSGAIIGNPGLAIIPIPPQTTVSTKDLPFPWYEKRITLTIKDPTSKNEKGNPPKIIRQIRFHDDNGPKMRSFKYDKGAYKEEGAETISPSDIIINSIGKIEQ